MSDFHDMKKTECNPGWPDWKDGGRTVELLLDNGETVSGRLYVQDYFFTGEDEVPIFMVSIDDGRNLSFADSKHWRFIDKFIK